ncbi:hypothetical protein CMV30_10380 [Nibricoccus aquaticus]|uniref:Phosphatidylcholine 1-acylhydrolase n=1 Tax=Nibricoccus aquaticus TaxID=2576891 RepID=A0A290Q7U1_9BACT|nr:phospholipase A [Nibricoccus aquaticus]ATC64327.1 hypothetical protein CMV30_10380 [Nibricoccus aquaticus]
MMHRFIAFTFALIGAAATALAAPIFNLLPPSSAVAPGSEVRIDLVALNPLTTEAVFEAPPTIGGTLILDTRSWTLSLRAEEAPSELIAAGGFGVRTYIFTVPKDLQGRVILEVTGITGSPLHAVLDINPSAASNPGSTSSSQSLTSLIAARPAATSLLRTFAGRLGVHEPIYFIYGPDDPVGKFQFSFKYRLLNLGQVTSKIVPATLQFAYTQRSLWDMSADSSPFYDTSYMPELIFESLAPATAKTGTGLTWLGYQVALKHESNGREGFDSRSLNTAYLRTALALGNLDGWHMLVVPEVFTYLTSLEDNPELKDYRGYGQLRLILGKNEGLSLVTTLWAGKEFDHPSMQLDLTLPVRTRLLDFETYFLIQYFNGYGESLRAYELKTSTIRAGFSFVR